MIIRKYNPKKIIILYFYKKNKFDSNNSKINSIIKEEDENKK